MTDPMRLYANMVVQVRRWLADSDSEEDKFEMTHQIEETHSKSKSAYASKKGARSQRRRAPDSRVPRRVLYGEQVCPRMEGDGSGDAKAALSPRVSSSPTVVSALDSTSTIPGDSSDSLVILNESCTSSTLTVGPSVETAPTTGGLISFSGASASSDNLTTYSDDTQTTTRELNQIDISKEIFNRVTEPLTGEAETLTGGNNFKSDAIKSSSIAMKKITESVLSTWSTISSAISQSSSISLSSKIETNRLSNANAGTRSSTFAIADVKSSKFKGPNRRISQGSSDPTETTEEDYETKVTASTKLRTVESKTSTFSISESSKIWTKARENWALTLTRAQCANFVEVSHHSDPRSCDYSEENFLTNNLSSGVNANVISLADLMGSTEGDGTTDITSAFLEDSENISSSQKSSVTPFQKTEEHFRNDSSQMEKTKVIIRSCLSHTDKSGYEAPTANNSKSEHDIFPLCIRRLQRFPRSINSETHSIDVKIQKCTIEPPQDSAYISTSQSLLCISSSSYQSDEDTSTTNISQTLGSELQLCGCHGTWSCPILPIQNYGSSMAMLEEQAPQEALVETDLVKQDSELNCLVVEGKGGRDLFEITEPSSAEKNISAEKVYQGSETSIPADCQIPMDFDKKLQLWLRWRLRRLHGETGPRPEDEARAEAVEAATARLVVAALEAAEAARRRRTHHPPPPSETEALAGCEGPTFHEWITTLRRLRGGGGGGGGVGCDDDEVAGAERLSIHCVPCAACGACARCGACMACGAVRRPPK